MIYCSVETFVVKKFGNFLGSLSAHAVYYSAFIAMFFYESFYYSDFFFLLISFLYVKTQVRTVERGNEHFRFIHSQLFYYVLTCNFVCCGSKCHYRNPGELFSKYVQLCVFRAEIMSPLRNAVSFVYGKKRYINVSEQIVCF